MSEIRNPIFPPTFNRSAPPGTCVWCAQDLPRTKSGAINRATKYHKECRDRYNFATNPRIARQILFSRDRGICAVCLTTCNEWRRVTPQMRLLYPNECDEADSIVSSFPFTRVIFVPVFELDHIVPLWSVDRSSTDAWRYWQLENAQTLCRAHHFAKSQKETRQRAKELRIRNRGGLVTKKPSQRERAIKRMKDRLPF